MDGSVGVRTLSSLVEESSQCPQDDWETVYNPSSRGSGILLSNLCGHQALVSLSIHVCRQNSQIHKNNKSQKKK